MFINLGPILAIRIFPFSQRFNVGHWPYTFTFRILRLILAVNLSLGNWQSSLDQSWQQEFFHTQPLKIKKSVFCTHVESLGRKIILSLLLINPGPILAIRNLTYLTFKLRPFDFSTKSKVNTGEKINFTKLSVNPGPILANGINQIFRSFN